ncbi:nitrile hydratase subunit alpha [Deltaproteobacteria bacterium TL4]
MNYEEIIQKTWNDESFKNQMLNDPKAVFADLGQILDENITFDVHCDTEDTKHFVLVEGNLKLGPVGMVTKRAYEDTEYRARLLGSTPKQAILEVLGIEPPFNVVIHENTDQHIHLVLPENPDRLGELSDSDLAMVAGGKTGQEWNQKVCHGMEKLFLKGEEKLGAGTMGGFLGTLSVLAGPLMTGGVAFSRAASAME